MITSHSLALRNHEQICVLPINLDTEITKLLAFFSHGIHEPFHLWYTWYCVCRCPGGFNTGMSNYIMSNWIRSPFCGACFVLFILSYSIYLFNPIIHGFQGSFTGKGNHIMLRHGSLTRYAKLQFAHAPGMPGTFPPAADFEGNRYLAIPACITARAWRTCRDACRDRLPAVTGKTFPAFPAHAHPQFCVSGKRPMFKCRWNLDLGI